MIEQELESAARAPGPLRVVVVEDDAVLREKVLVAGLALEGFLAKGAASALDLYRQMTVDRFDVAVLDLGLPDEDGFMVARHLRNTTSMGIVILSGSGSDADKLRSLQEGGDIYLSKPVNIQVLAANLRNLSSRIRSHQLRAAVGWGQERGGWRLLAPNGTTVTLTLAEKQLVEVLFAHPGEPVQREQLISRLAEDTHDFDPHRLEMMVYRLRLKCERETGVKLPLRAVRGIGYMLTP